MYSNLSGANLVCDKASAAANSRKKLVKIQASCSVGQSESHSKRKSTNREINLFKTRKRRVVLYNSNKYVLPPVYQL